MVPPLRGGLLLSTPWPYRQPPVFRRSTLLYGGLASVLQCHVDIDWQLRVRVPLWNGGMHRDGLGRMDWERQRWTGRMDLFRGDFNGFFVIPFSSPLPLRSPSPSPSLRSPSLSLADLYIIRLQSSSAGRLFTRPAPPGDGT